MTDSDIEAACMQMSQRYDECGMGVGANYSMIEMFVEEFTFVLQLNKSRPPGIRIYYWLVRFLIQNFYLLTNVPASTTLFLPWAQEYAFHCCYNDERTRDKVAHINI